MKFNEILIQVQQKLRPSYVKVAVLRAGDLVKQYFSAFRKKIEEIIAAAKADIKERNRIMLLTISGLFFFGYLMMCLLVDKNIFDIFPPVPAIKQYKTISIYVPSDGCTEIVKEQVRVYSAIEDDKLVHRLFYLVADGLKQENTRFNVPAEFIIKKIWIVESEDGNGKTCVIDLMPVMLQKEITVVKGSEQMFRGALEKTIVENVPGIKKVILLEKGIPNKRLWEI